LVCALRGAAGAQEDPPIHPAWLEKARIDGKAAYEKYRAVAEHIEETSEMRADKSPGGIGTTPIRPQTVRDHTVRLGDNFINEKVRLFEGPDQPMISLECDNTDYHFSLRKSKPDAPYALVGYEPGRRTLPLAQIGNGLHKDVFSYLRQIVVAAEASDDNKYLLRELQFDAAKQLLRAVVTTNPRKNPIENTVLVDPGQGWRVVEIRAVNSAGVSTTRVSYGKVVEGVEFPTGQEMLSKSNVDTGPQDIDAKTKLVSLKLTDKTPADFRLTAFGLPEPAEFAPPVRATPWYLWILAAAGVSAALAAWLRYLHRRRNREGMVSAPDGGQ
jgi:hypothetical protein